MLQRRPLRVSVVAALTAMVLLPAGCAGSKDAEVKTSTGPTTTFDIPKDELVSKLGEATVTISAVDNTLEPQYVEITAGTKVIFKNEGRNAHDIVPAADGAFDGVGQAQFPPGSSHIVTFDTAGDFPYFCSVHGTMKHGMNGAIRVVAAS
jgi:plastocyanin